MSSWGDGRLVRHSLRDGAIPSSLLSFSSNSDLGSFLLFASVSHDYFDGCPMQKSDRARRFGLTGSLHVPRSLRFITPGALEVVLRFLSSMPTPESSLDISDVSADMLCEWL
jgi:hypothetical protein